VIVSFIYVKYVKKPADTGFEKLTSGDNSNNPTSRETTYMHLKCASRTLR